MKNEVNSVLTKRKSFAKKVLIINLAVFICVIVFIKTSYAWFTKTDVVKSIQIVVNDLIYTLQSDFLNSANQVTVAAGERLMFDILVTNDNPLDTKYQMVYSSSDNLSRVKIGYNVETLDATSGTIKKNESKLISVIIRNNGLSSVTFKFDVRGGLKNNEVSDILLAKTDKKLNTELKIADITLENITVDGEKATSLPVNGTYILSNYNCKNNSSLSWDRYTKNITFGANSSVAGGEDCSLDFTKSTDYPLLIDIAKQGDYIAYEGNNGCLKDGDKEQTLDGALTATVENQNSCLGYNANATTDGKKDSEYGMYGYCYTPNFRYYVNGWRIAYTDSDRVYIISAGSPECNERPNSTVGNLDYITAANINAKKYCNSTFVDDCTSDTDVHAINDTDFNKMTAQMTNTVGGYLYTSIKGAKKCGGVFSTVACGYNNDLIDNGGYYWFASAYSVSDTSYGTWGVSRDPSLRNITANNEIFEYGLRPVIRLSSSVYVTGGSGTMDDPYTIIKQ